MDSYLAERIREARSNRFLTNNYSGIVIDPIDQLIETDDSFLFTYNDHGVLRILYYVKDKGVLEKMLLSLKGGKYYIEEMSRFSDNPMPKSLSVVAKMMRVANTDCRKIFDDQLPVLKYRDDDIGSIATGEDVEEINSILWSTFKTEVSHLLYDNELEEIVKKGQVIIHRTINLDAILQVEKMPKRFYINQVINRAEKKIIHAIMIKQLWQYVQNGGKYAYAWVEDNNVASLKFHEKYGMTHDGMWNTVYCFEK